MDLRELLSRTGRTYDRALGQSSEAQLLLRGAKASIADLVKVYAKFIDGGQAVALRRVGEWLGRAVDRR